MEGEMVNCALRIAHWGDELCALAYTYCIMDIEFVQLEHRADIANLMEVTGADLQTAYDLYHRHRCNLQAAASEHLGLVSPMRAPQAQEEPEFDNDEPIGLSFDEEADPEFHRYCRFLDQGANFLKKYPIKGNPHQKKEKNGKEEHGENHSFRKDLEDFVEKRVNFKVEAGKVEDALVWSWKERFPIAIMVVNFEGDCGEALKNNLTNEPLLNEIVTYFKVYGFNPSMPLEGWLRQFIRLPDDHNSLIILRVSFMDEIQNIGRIKLDADSPEKIAKQVQRFKSETIHREYDEAHITKQHALMRKGAAAYRRPPSIKERVRLREDAKLRRQQDEEFFKACQIKSTPKEGKVTETEKKKERIPSKKELDEGRAEQRKKLTLHSEGMCFKLRMPSGRAEQLVVNGGEPVQYFFDFVESHPEELGFERDHKRNFDIVHGPEKNKSLLAAKQEKIEEVLEEFELLIVKELDQ